MTTRLVYHPELMKNYACQVPVGAGEEFRTLLDANGHPLIFAIGSDRHLRLIGRAHKDPERPGAVADAAPWQVTSLVAGPVHAFAVAQDRESGDLRLAYATFEGGNPRLYSSKRRNNDRTTWKPGETFEWVEHSLDADVVGINRIEIDFEHMMFACTESQRRASYHLAGFDAVPARQELSLPQDCDRIVDFKVGSYGSGMMRSKGTFLLYEMDQPDGLRQVLLFQAFPGTEMERIPVEFTIEEGHGVSSIDLIRNGDGSDQLLVCGNSVRLYESDEIRHELIAKRSTSFRDIQVGQAGGYNSVWAIEEWANQQFRLVFLTDRYFDPVTQSFQDAPKWTPDLPFMDDVRQFSCIKGSANGNHLILVDPGNQLSHLYQDPSTTVWGRDAIAVWLNEIVEFPCYTTRLLLQKDERGTPVTGQECLVRSSSQVNATINGIAYQLGPEKPVSVKTDFMGALTIVNPLPDDIGTPVFYVEHSGTTDILDPTREMEERLRAIKSVEEFRKACTDDGQPLWPGGGTSPTDDDLRDALPIFKQLLDCKKGLLDDGLAKVRNEPLPPRADQATWGVSFSGSRALEYLDETSAQKLLADDDAQGGGGFHPFQWIGHAFGTVIHAIGSIIRGLETTFGKLRSFVVKQVNRITTFVLNVGGQVVHFVIDTLEKVCPFLKVIFDALGLVFKTVLRWLGRLLGWDAIWATHKMIARMTKNGAKSIETHIDRTVKEWAPHAHDRVEQLRKHLQEIEDLPDGDDRQKNVLMTLLTSPLFTWPLYMLQHIVGAMEKLAEVAKEVLEKLSDFLTKQAEVYEYVADFVHDQAKAILDFAASPGFSSEKLLKLFGPLLDRILDGVDELIALIQGLLEFVAGAVAKVVEGFDDPAEIPFVTPLYKWLTGLLGEEETFSLLNGFSLMVSVPLTTFYRLLSGGKRPFEPVTDGFGEASMFDDFWGAAPGGRSTAQEGSARDQRIYEYQRWGGMVGSIFGPMAEIFSIEKNELKGPNYFIMVLNGVAHAATIPITVHGRETPQKEAADDLRWAQFALSLIPAYVLPFDLRQLTARSKHIINMVFSVLSLGTNISANVLDNPGGLSWFAQMSSRLGSLLLSAGELLKEPEMTIGAIVPIAGGGGSSLMNAYPTEDHDRHHGTQGR
ncbi:MAG TPA: hypothetical protein VGF69_12690 [Thermoanaerobaculia bacterium]|jgi:hypothetical protein